MRQAISATGQSQHSLPYNPALDGIRGIAILLVIPAHLHALSGGAFGVDIFFVLSGFLITEVVRNAVGSPGFFGAFYLRRFLRLFPALAVTCTAVVVVFAVFSDGHRVYDDALASLLYVQSWTSAAGDGFAVYLGHTWSLSVEEQFYLFWPVLFWLLSRGRSADALVLGAAASIAVLGYAWAFSLEPYSIYDRVYCAPDCRFEAIMIGAAGAAFRRTSLFRWRVVQLLLHGSGPALVAILGMSYLYTWNELHGLIVALLACVVILSAAERRASPDIRLLTWPPLVWVGRISYSLYLWHVPVLAVLLLDFHVHEGVAAIIGLPVSVLLACGSYYWIEQPFINLRSRIGRARQAMLGRIALGSSILSIATGLVIFNWNGMAEWLHPQPLAMLGYGPPAFHIGDKAALQPNGALALWMKFNKRPDMQSHATVDGVPATTFTTRDTVVVIVPPSLAAAPGQRVVQVFSLYGVAETPKLSLDILPPQ